MVGTTLSSGSVNISLSDASIPPKGIIFTVNDFKGSGPYPLTGRGIAILTSPGGGKAVAGSAVMSEDGQSGTWTADFSNGDHSVGSFAC
jgi:hypothetical protein